MIFFQAFTLCQQAEENGDELHKALYTVILSYCSVPILEMEALGHIFPCPVAKILVTTERHEEIIVFFPHIVGKQSLLIQPCFSQQNISTIT
jgi:hypothetical protein